MSVSLVSQRKENANWKKHTFEVLDRTEHLLTNLREVGSWQSNYSLAGEEIYLASYLVASNSLSGNLAQLRLLVQDEPAQQHHLDVLNRLVDINLATLQHTIALRRDNDTKGILATARDSKSGDLMESIHVEASAIAQQERDLMAQLETNFDKSLSFFLTLFIFVVCLIILFASMLVYRTYRATRLQLTAQGNQNKSMEQRVHKSTEDLALERNKLSAVFESSKIGLVFANTQGGDLTMNAAALGFYGLSSDADMHSRIEEHANDWKLRDAEGRVIHVKDWPIVRAGRGDYVLNMEIACLNTKSGYQWIGSYTSEPVRNIEGEIIQVVMTIVDITKRKRAEDALLVSTFKYQNLFENSRDALMVTSLTSGEFVEANPATLKLFGAASLAEFTTLGPGVVSPERQPDGSLSRDKSLEMLERTVSEGSHAFEWEHQRMDGKTFTADVLMTHLWSEGDELVQATVRDITERKRADEELAISSKILDTERLLFQAILDTAPIGIWLLGTDNKIKFINRTFCNAVGVAEHQFVTAAHYSDLLPPLASVNCMKSDRECFEQEAPHLSTEWLPFVDGNDHLLDITKVKIYDKNGDLFGLIGLALDITARKQAEAELKKLNAQAHAVMEQQVVAQTIMALAHELNQPLNAAGIYSSTALMMLNQGELDKAEISQSIKLNVVEIQRAGAVLRDLLHNVHKNETDDETFDLIEAVRASIKLFQGDLAENAVAVVLDKGMDVCMVSTKKTVLKKTLTNLLLNAHQALTSTDPKTNDAMITVRVAQERDSAVVTVVDNGPGVSDDVVAKLFTPFFTTKQQGIGVGLNISRALVESCGGQLRYDPVDGQTAFHITIPATLSGQPSDANNLHC